MMFRIQIFSEYLPNCIFHILTFHLTAQFLQPTKLILFCGKQNEKEIKLR